MESFQKIRPVTYNDILGIQYELNPSSVILTPSELLEYHDDLNTRSIITSVLSSFPSAVCYRLRGGECEAQEGYSCNGVRFGAGGEYLSLPHISLRG